MTILVESYPIQKHDAEKDISINSSLSLMDIDTSAIAKLFGDDKMFAALVSMHWLSDSQINTSIGESKAIDSMCEDAQANINSESIISTFIEVALNQIIHLELNMKECLIC